MPDTASLSIDGRIATLTLERAEARNALSIALLRETLARLDELAAAPGPTVLVLTGAGRAFCAGMDLKAVLGDPDAPRTLLTLLAELCLKLRGLPLVTVAKVNGAAIGGGCGLACVCDVAITHADAKLGFPEVDLGVCPAVVAPWLVRKIGAGRARRVLLCGGLQSGEEAHRLGIVDVLAPDRGALDSAAAELAARLAAGGPNALRATKGLLNELDGSLDAEQAREAAALSARVLALPEAQALLRARLEPDGARSQPERGRA